MIKLLIFDLGGVVFTQDDDPMHEPEFLSSFNISIGNLATGWNSAWDRYKTGKVTEDEFWKILLTESGTKNIDIQLAKDLWRKYSHPQPGMFELLTVLKSKYKLAVLSNIGIEHMQYKEDEYKMKDLFELIVASGREGLAKPDPEFYKALLLKENITATECLFIDDLPRNIDVAKSLGFEGIVFKGASDLRNQLSARGLI